jgi:hypothetical protein
MTPMAAAGTAIHFSTLTIHLASRTRMSSWCKQDVDLAVLLGDLKNAFSFEPASLDRVAVSASCVRQL